MLCRGAACELSTGWDLRRLAASGLHGCCLQERRSGTVQDTTEPIFYYSRSLDKTCYTHMIKPTLQVHSSCAAVQLLVSCSNWIMQVGRCRCFAKELLVIYPLAGTYAHDTPACCLWAARLMPTRRTPTHRAGYNASAVACRETSATKDDVLSATRTDFRCRSRSLSKH